MSPRAPVRVDFAHPAGNGDTIALITEYYGPYAKFYAELYLKKKDELQRSRPAYWEGESDIPAKKEAELVAKGWQRRS